MSSTMSLQLVGASEALPAEKPVANKWSFAGVPSKMSSQMGRLAVYYSTESC